MNELIQQVITLTEERGILAHSTPEKQYLKFMSELGELCDELVKENYEAARMELGDVIVTIILYFELCGYRYRKVNGTYRYKNTQDYVKGLPSFVDSLFDSSISDSISFLAKEINSTPEECLSLALDKITKRKTTMVNGVAVKE